MGLELPCSAFSAEKIRQGRAGEEEGWWGRGQGGSRKEETSSEAPPCTVCTLLLLFLILDSCFCHSSFIIIKELFLLRRCEMEMDYYIQSSSSINN
jgi:hypothetical protein